jgi:hypothetical protein
MIQIAVSVEIQRPPEAVFLYLADTENETQWQPGLIESKFTSPPPMVWELPAATSGSSWGCGR